MGQYHLLVNLDRREFVAPHKLGVGLKLMEQACSQGGTAMALILLLAASCRNSAGDVGRGGGDPHTPDPHHVVGRWVGQRVCFIGDYAEKNDILWEFGNADEIYGLCRDDEDRASPDYEPDPEGREFTDISDKVADYIEREEGGRFVGDGWKRFVQPNETVQRWTTKPVAGQVKEEGKVISVKPGCKKITVEWPAGTETYPVDKSVPFF